MENYTEIDGSTEHDAADIMVCHQVNEVLQKYYPGHLWLVGVNHDAGTVHIELPYQTRIQTRFPYGILLYTSSMKVHSEMEKKVMRAGGELLERYNLARGRGTIESAMLAKQNGLITDGAIK